MKKKRTYKIQRLAGVPSLNIRGKFLEELGVEVGSRWEMVIENDTIILKKIPEAVAKYQDAVSELKQAKQATTICENQVKHLAVQINGGDTQ